MGALPRPLLGQSQAAGGGAAADERSCPSSPRSGSGAAIKVARRGGLPSRRACARDGAPRRERLPGGPGEASLARPLPRPAGAAAPPTGRLRPAPRRDVPPLARGPPGARRDLPVPRRGRRGRRPALLRDLRPGLLLRRPRGLAGPAALLPPRPAGGAHPRRRGRRAPHDVVSGAGPCRVAHALSVPWVFCLG